MSTSARVRAARLVDQAVQDRQQERRRLAAAGLRAGEHVAALHRGRDRVGLDGGGTGETELAYALEQTRVKLQGC